jgi:hypothetical protein
MIHGTSENKYSLNMQVSPAPMAALGQAIGGRVGRIELSILESLINRLPSAFAARRNGEFRPRPS